MPILFVSKRVTRSAESLRWGHTHEMGAVLIDEDLLQYEELWAAAGTPHAVFRLTPRQLIQIANGKVVSIK
jgi:prolyl-tRNA editing enzyme YbaK/EbsC (Cys-tRNA(Pro) deacylase)